MAHKLLLVDDDADILEIHATYLSGQGYEIAQAGNGRKAIEWLEKNPVDLVLSDVKMPDLNGLDLLLWTKQHKPTVKVILVTGIAGAAETKKAVEAGCTSLLPKPASKEDLISTVSAALNPSAFIESKQGAFEEGTPFDFAYIDIEDFLAGKNIEYSIYIQLQKTKYVKLANKGEDLDLDRVVSLKNKGIRHLWLKKEDFDKYQKMSLALAKAVTETGKLPIEKKRRILNHACAVAAEKMRLVGVNEASITESQNLLTLAMENLCQVQGGLDLAETIESAGPTPYSHAVTVASLCALITQVMGWSSLKNIVALTLGGFLHDIGLNETDPDLFLKDPEKMTDKEKGIYRNHPMMGSRKIAEMPKMPREISAIVLQHHENSMGTGFPQGLLRSDIFPMAKIVSLVDKFADQVALLPPGRKVSSKKALNDLIQQNRGVFDHAAILALETLFSAPDLPSAQKTYQSRMNTFGT